MKSPFVLSPLNYSCVELTPSHFSKQYKDALEYILAIPNDDMLVGFRRRAGLPHPGNELGGWYSNDGSFDIYTWEEIANAFPQWISFLARSYRITGDERARTKAVEMLDEWAKTVEPDGYCFYSRALLVQYSFDKHVQSLLDAHEFLGWEPAFKYLDMIVGWGEKNLCRSRIPASPLHLNFTGGDPAIGIMDNEWYTLGESLYRAYEMTGEERYKEFAAVWHYDHYWDGLRRRDPESMTGLHGYSHVNTLGSAALAYRVTGEEKYKETLVAAYDMFQNYQMLANGGYALAEHMGDPRGSNYYTIEYEGKSFEVCCGSWAVFKTVRHLLSLTGEARFGQWAEAVLYNAIGSALPFKDDCQRRGKTFYYSDLRLGGGKKLYFEHSFPCCSGTYPQAVAEYTNIISYTGENGLYISQYIPSVIDTGIGEKSVKVEIAGNYPFEDCIQLKMHSAGEYAVHLRVPAWVKRGSATISLNGRAMDVTAEPNEWAVLSREWEEGDVVEITFPMYLRLFPIHTYYPWRTALMYGPWMLCAEGRVPRLKGSYLDADSVAKHAGGLRFLAETPDGGEVVFRPYMEFEEKEWGTVYFDLDKTSNPLY